MIVIDRFEGDKAVIEFSQDNGRLLFDIPRAILPKGAKEGDIIKLSVDRMATQKRKDRIESLSDELFEK